MRAHEFISESKEDFAPEQKAAIPGMQVFPGLDNSNPYHMWRFIVATAAQPADGSVPDFALDGPLGQKMNTISYSKADAEILDATAKSLGLEKKDVSTQPSEEPDDTNVVSPVRGFKGYAR